MTDPTNDIDALLRRVDPHCEFCGFIDAVDCARYHRALTALVAERNALREGNLSLVAERAELRKRVETLELQSARWRDQHPPADRDEAMERWMNAVTGMLGNHAMPHPNSMKDDLASRRDAAIAAMRKGEA